MIRYKAIDMQPTDSKTKALRSDMLSEEGLPCFAFIVLGHVGQ
ncbi:MAG: hypothetical protein ACXIT9_04030 [Nitritalea sp.]